MEALELGVLAAPDRAMVASGSPMQLAVDSIDEDPAQPRREFEAEALQELADSILLRGLITPISVRPHPTDAGRWMLNAGARRLRATRIAGRSQIPAFVDHSFNSYDQVIENEQRLGLQPIELALFVQRELNQGVTRAEVARRLGKSKAYVTFVCAMIDPPDWLLAAYRANQCRGLQELYELRRLHETEPDKVEAWLTGHGSVTRQDTLMLREQCATTVPIEGLEGMPSANGVKPDVADAKGKPLDRVTTHPRIPRVASSRALRVVAVVGGVEVHVVTDAVPAAEGRVFVADDASGNGRRSTSISALQSIRLIRL